jgi:hypothetical protein
LEKDLRKGFRARIPGEAFGKGPLIEARREAAAAPFGGEREIKKT